MSAFFRIWILFRSRYSNTSNAGKQRYDTIGRIATSSAAGVAQSRIRYICRSQVHSHLSSLSPFSVICRRRKAGSSLKHLGSRSVFHSPDAGRFALALALLGR
jgi:hypothetical protein